MLSHDTRAAGTEPPHTHSTARFNTRLVHPQADGDPDGAVNVPIYQSSTFAFRNAAHGRCGLTAELNVRFRHPVRTGRLTVIQAWVERDATPLFVLRAEVSQDGQRKATAIGRFMAPVTLEC